MTSQLDIGEVRDLEEKGRVLAVRLERVANALGLAEDALADVMERAARSSGSETSRWYVEATSARQAASMCRKLIARLHELSLGGGQGGEKE